MMRHSLSRSVSTKIRCSAALVAVAVTFAQCAAACTAFCAANSQLVLVGNNEDYSNPRTRLWFVPSAPGSFGRMYVGYDNLTPQGGMNERGLWFDGFATPHVDATGSANLPHFAGDLADRALAECATVEEVIRLFERYSRDFLANAVVMFADAKGDAVAIESNAIVRKSGRFFVQTNFHHSLQERERVDDRFKRASAMLAQAGDDLSVDLFRRILAATHQEGIIATQYSNVYDLKSRTMYLYHFHDFDHVVVFRLSDELKKGRHVIDIPALFARTTSAPASSR
jgi:penicillin V acylase-like amidase (Ntn superfamily)